MLNNILPSSIPDGTRLNIRKDNVPCYDIVYHKNFGGLKAEIAALDGANRRICVITDSHVEPLYANNVFQIIRNIRPDAELLVLKAGEEFKNLNSIYDIYRFLIEHHYDRRGLLIALGGGVIGDVTGFAAASFLRGIDFVQIPTTLLSQADSSIGGKTGVDFEGYKNMIGAFYMPRLVYANVGALPTLSQAQFASGFAEVMKHGLILDRTYYDWLTGHADQIEARNPDILQSMLYRSNEIKKYVVEKDPYEKNLRMYLNFGHTLGHAIEKNSQFTMTHGQCVALGCVAAAYISLQRSFITETDYRRIRNGFISFHLDVTLSGMNKATILSLTKSDKKMKNGQIQFVLLHGIGDAFVDSTVSDEEILNAVSELENPTIV